MKTRFLIAALLTVLVYAQPIQAIVVVDQTTWLQKRLVTADLEVSVSASEQLEISLGGIIRGTMEDESLLETDGRFSLAYRTDRLDLLLGMNEFAFGRARLNPVFLGGNHVHFLSAAYTLKGESWDFFKAFGDLRVTEDYKRVGVQYFTWNPFDFLSIGLGEAFVTQEPFSGDLVYYVTPFLPYYLSKYIPGIHSRPNNSLMYADAEVVWRDTSFYGELIVSEFPMTPSATNPDLWGLTLGFETQLSDWSIIAEFCRVQNYTYANNSPSDTTFALGERPLGHPFGDDLLSINLQGSRAWTSKLATDIGIFHRAFGESILSEWYSSGSEWQENRFMSGTPEQQYGISAGIEYGPSPNLLVGAEVEVAMVQNYGHQPDRTGYHHQAILKATLLLP